MGFRSKGLFTGGMEFVGNSPCTTHCAGSALIQITGSPFGGIKALCVLLCQGTGGKSFPPLIITNQRFGEMLKGFISFIGGFLASRVLLVAWTELGWLRLRDPEGICACPGSERTQTSFLWHVAVMPEARKPEGLAGTAERLQPYNWIAHCPTPLMQSEHWGWLRLSSLRSAPCIPREGKALELPGAQI